MKPLLKTVVALCLILASNALPENIEDVKELPQSKEPIIEAEESEPQARAERCTTCGTAKLNFKSPNEVLAAIQALPGAEVHSQSSFEGCSSEKGCAGIKVKDGRVIERFGNVDAFRAAAASDTDNEFSFHAAGTLGNGVFGAGIPKDGPFWWMNENSPFKNAAAASSGGGSFEKFSKSSSTFTSSGGGAGGTGGGAAFGAGIDLSANPFLNGEFSKLAGSAAGFGASAQGGSVQEAGKPSSFQSSSFESSSFSTSSKGGDIDLSKNPYLNGGYNKFGQSGSGFQAQGGFSSQAAGQGSAQNGFGTGQSGFNAAGQGSAFNAGGSTNQAAFAANQGTGQGFGAQGGFNGGASQSSFSQTSQSTFGTGQGAGNQGFSANAGFSGNKFSGAGYTGSSPSPFTASTAGSNVNLIQNTQKTSEFDFEQQQQTQTNIDEAFQGTGNVHAHEHSGGELQQTCAGQGYVCVHKAQCNNGVVNTNGASVLQAKTKKQYCNIRTEICCRIEISTIGGASGLQGSLGVGSATYSGSGNQGQGLFVSSTQGQGSSGSNFGAGQASGTFGAGQSSSSFGSSQTTTSSQNGAFGQRGSGTIGAGQNTGFAGQAGFGSTSSGSSTFGSSNRGSSFGQGSSTFGQGAQGSQGTGFQASGTFGTGTGTGTNRGTSVVETSSSSFESSTNRGSIGNTGKFGANGGFGFGSTVVPTTNRFGSGAGGNEVIYKQTSQTNFVETDSFSAGSEGAGIYRPGASGSGLKPGIPYLPPDNTNSGTNVVSSTAFPTTFLTTPRPFTTPRPTYLPPSPSTSAPGYLPPIQQGEQTINTETRLPGPPTYVDGQLILDQNIQPNRPPTPIAPPSEVPSGCAAALKCTPIEYCTAEGVISNSTVALTRDQEAYRVPLTDCKDLETGRVGKCCRDPYYTDPWPTNQLGKWVPGVFGGNDGKYVADSRGSPSNRPTVTVRPPVTGSTLLNNFRTPKPTVPSFGPNQVTPGFSTSVSQGSFGQKGQFEVRGQGQYSQGGQGQYSQGGQGQFGVAGQGQAAQGGQGQFGSGSSFSQTSQTFQQTQRGQGQIATGGQGQFVSQGQGQFAQGGAGQLGIGGQGQTGFGAQGQVSVQEQTSQFQGQKTFGQNVNNQRGQGQAVLTGQGQTVSQGFGTGIRQGSGFQVTQGGGFNVENEYSESSRRVFLQQYSAGGQCGAFNGQKPYGNRNELEVDFAEIPWQAMVLLKTNKSLLCGGVITRPDVVLTSAACVEGLQAKNVLIKGGEWKLGIDDEPLPFQIVQVKNILKHPFYKRGSLQYDAAILVLSENLRFAKNIYPICLPGARDTLDAFYNGAGECIVTGWGKQVLQAHLAGAIMHSLNVSLINPGECQAKLSQDYPHLLEQYDQESCACGQPTNPVNNICRVDTGSALACTTGDGHWVLRGIYSWDSGCQPGNQLAAFYKFDLEWYEWAIGLLESARFAQFSTASRYTQSGSSSGVKGGSTGGIKGGFQVGLGGLGASVGFGSGNQFSSGQFGQFSSKFSEASSGESAKFGQEVSGPITNSFSASYTEKKVFKSEPKIVTYTTKPEIVTFTTKPEIFTYTTKPKLVTYTTKPQIITYETSGSGTNPQYVAPGVTFNPSFSELVGTHKHNAACKCLEVKK